ncbi:hypothetical protein ABEF92_005723 [Exophiala dermatitidis]
MHAEPYPGHAPEQPASIRLKLIMPEHGNDQRQSSNAGANPEHAHQRALESSGSPQRPSYSPVTPTLSHTSLQHDDDQVKLPPPEFMEEPDPLPVDLDDNPDAMALRATLSVLQLQRQQALRDMRELDRMKRAAMEDPEHFVRDLREGKLSASARQGVEVDDMEGPTDGSAAAAGSNFGRFPSPQNVMRCPPVEWAKYHIVGEALDRVHEVQQHYPGYSEDMGARNERLQPHTSAAPYRPFLDRLDSAKGDSKPRTTGS